MTRVRVSKAVVAVLASLAGSGCFGYYQPITTDLAGRRIQVSLNDSGSVVLAPRLGPGVEAVQGLLAADSANQYVVSVLTTRRRDGQESDWRGERVVVPYALVSSVSERRFSRARTAVFATLTGIALGASKRAFGGGGGATAPGTTPSQPGGK